MLDIGRFQERVSRAKQRYAKRKAKLRENYHYARDKGFSSYEAQILSFTSRENIDKLAMERQI